MGQNPTILVVDDEQAIVDVLHYNLTKAHYRVLVARDGKTALDLARHEKPDLVVLDLMLPGLDGLEVCRQLRADGNIPIIMLTARDEEVDRVVGLELGADDYVVKPFSTRELLARIKSVLRRAQADPDPQEKPLQVGSLHAFLDRYEATWNGTLLELTTLEFELLAALLRHPGQVLSREQLLQQVWGYDFPGDTRTVDTAVKRLRSKLRERDPEAASLVVTVRSVGYKIRDDG
jgi:DNA-binding response OmpR family regulator